MRFDWIFNRVTTRNQKAYKALKNLGGDKYAVSNALRALNVRGLRYKANSCPISNYLKRLGFSTPSVVATNFSINHDHGHETPGGVHDFILAFDSGEFPDLIGPS